MNTVNSSNPHNIAPIRRPRMPRNHRWLCAVVCLLLIAVGGMTNRAVAATYTYIILDSSNKQEAWCTNSTFGLPEDMTSPLATNFKYYTGLTATDDVYDVNSGTQISDVSSLSDGGTVYVTYDLSDEGKKLFAEGAEYQVYVTWKSSYMTYLNTTQLSYSSNSDYCQFKLTGDPYAMQLRSLSDNNLYIYSGSSGYLYLSTESTTNDPQKFIVLSDDVSKGFFLRRNNNTYDGSKGSYLESNQPKNRNITYTSHTYAEMKSNSYYFRFDRHYTYHLINRSGGEAMHYSQWISNTTSTVEFSSSLISKYAKNFNIYTTSQAAYENKGSESSEFINVSSSYDDLSAGTYDLYVGYDYDDTQGLNLDGGIYIFYRTAAGADGSGYFSSGTNYSSTFRPNVSLTDDAYFLWKLTGKDPYAITFQNVYYLDDQPEHFLTTQKASLPTSKSSWSLKSSSDSPKVTTFSLIGGDDNRLVAFAQDDSSQKFVVSTSDAWSLTYTLNTLDDLVKNSASSKMTFVKRTLVTYRIKNHSGYQALGDITGGYDDKPSLPTTYRSAMATNYKYYTADNVTYDATTKAISINEGAAEIDPATYSPSNGDIIYVTYEYNSDGGVDLTGATTYLFNDNNNDHYLACTNSEAEQPWNSAKYYELNLGNSSTLPANITNQWLWTFNGEDPYNITIRSADPTKSEYFLTPEKAGTTFNGSGINAWLLHDGVSVDCIRTWALLTGNKLITELMPDNDEYVFYIDARTPPWMMRMDYKTLAATTSPTVALTPIIDVTYKVVNNRGVRAVWYESGHTDDTPAIPACIQSPLATGYRYYTTYEAAVADKDGSTYSGNFTSFSTAGVNSGDTIYVRYSLKAGQDVLSTTADKTFYMYIGGTSTTSNYCRGAVLDINGSNTYVQNGNQSDWWEDYCVYGNSQLWYFSGTDPYDAVLKTVWDKDAYVYAKASSSSDTTARTTTVESDRDNLSILYCNYKDKTGYSLLRTPKAQITDFRILRGDESEFAFQENTGLDNSDRTNSTNKVNLLEMVTPGVCYVVINKADSVAIFFHDASQKTGAAPSIPKVIASPLVTTYHYWSDRACTNALESLPSDDCTVYVTYDIDTDDPLFDLSGGTEYNIIAPKVSNRYFYNNASSTSGDNIYSNASTADADKLTADYKWKLRGGDPYNMEISSSNSDYSLQWASEGSLTTSDTRPTTEMARYLRTDQSRFSETTANRDNHYSKKWKKFIITQASTSGYYQLLSSWRSYNMDSLTYVRMVDGNTNHLLESSTSLTVDADGRQFKIIDPYHVDVVYHIMKDATTEVARATVLRQDVSSKPTLPDSLVSPLAGTYTYYKEADFTDDTYKYGDSDPLCIAASDVSMDVYVRYTDGNVLDLWGDTEGKDSTSYYVIFNGNLHAYTTSANTLSLSEDELIGDSTYFWYLEASGDPYQVRLKNEATGKYLYYDSATDGTAVTLSDEGSLFYFRQGKNAVAGQYEVVALTGSLTSTYTDVTDSTLTLALDGSGGLRLLKSSSADAQQVTLKTTDVTFTYIFIDNQGNEALRYASTGDVTPTIPVQFQSPAATNYTFYRSADCDEASRITRLKGAVLNDERNVYIRYEYNSSGDPQYLVQGAWVNMKVNGSYAQLSGSSITTASEAKSTSDWQWRLKSDGDADPYNVRLFTRSDKSDSVEAAEVVTSIKKQDGEAAVNVSTTTNATHFALLPFLNDDTTPSPSRHHAPGLTYDTKYVLAVTGTQDTTFYYFLNQTTGASTVTVLADTAFAKNSAFKNNTGPQLHFTNIVPTNVTYRIITHTGKVALQYTYENAQSNTSLESWGANEAMPSWMRSPLMVTNAYTFYATADSTGTGDSKTFSNFSDSTTTLLGLDNDIVYVRYDYNKSKKATKQGTGDLEKEAPVLDLSGQHYYWLNSEDNYWWSFYIFGSDSIVHTYHSSQSSSSDFRPYHEKNLWTLSGNDPYEVTFTSYMYGSDCVLAASKPSSSDNDAEFNITKSPSTKYHTFMILKGDETYTGLMVYATGNDSLFIRGSGTSGNDNKLYLRWDGSNYAKRLASTDKYKHFTNGQFLFYPAVIYHVITNDGVEAISSASNGDSRTVKMPDHIRTPILSQDDFSYYTNATYADGVYTVDASSVVANGASLDSLSEVTDGSDIYVRYTYNRDTSPVKYPQGISSTDSLGLDLSGGTWYNIAVYRAHTITTGETKDTTIYYTYPVKYDSPTSIFVDKYNDLGNATLSGSKYLCRFDGDDPYAIKIYNNEAEDKYMTGNDDSEPQLSFDSNKDSQYQTFFLLYTISGDADDIVLNRTAAFFPTGKARNYMVCWVPISGVSHSLIQHVTNTGGKEFSYRNGTWAGTGYKSHGSWNYFYKAPMARNYIFHAINVDDEDNTTQTWEKKIVRDMYTPAKLTTDMKRLFCQYEEKDTANTYRTSATGRFYTDSTFGTVIVGNNIEGNYPEVDEGGSLDIYFKYKTVDAVKPTGVGDSVTGFRYSSAATIQADIARHAADANDTTLNARWYLPVINLNNRGGTAYGRYFLQYQGDGDSTLVSYYTSPILNEEDDYCRLIQKLKPAQSDPWQEGRWLFAFTGDPYQTKVVNMYASSDYTDYSATGSGTLGTVRYVAHTDSTLALKADGGTTADYVEWGLMDVGNQEGGIALNLNTTRQGNHTVDSLYWYFDTKQVALCDSPVIASKTANAVKLLPYKALAWVDTVTMKVRTLDEVDGETVIKYYTSPATGDKVEYGTDYDFTNITDREYAVGDQFTVDEVPLAVRRKFCTYELVTDGTFQTVAADQTNVTIQDGGTIYLRYDVSDYGKSLFVRDNVGKIDEAKDAVKTDTLGNVWFLDFPLANSKKDGCGITGLHAYYGVQSDEGSGVQVLTHTTEYRYQLAPQNLYWYLVGDPYELQLFNVKQDKSIARKTLNDDDIKQVIAGGDIVVWQYRVDCADFNSTASFDNRNWEMVLPRLDGDNQSLITDNGESEFALRLVAEDQSLTYHGTQYYLSPEYHQNYMYEEREGWNVTNMFPVNLRYTNGNRQTTYTDPYSGTTYANWPVANIDTCAIRLVRPSRVFVTTYKDMGSEGFTGPITIDELSEYYGIGETLTSVPRNVARDFCNYELLDGSQDTYPTKVVASPFSYTIPARKNFINVGYKVTEYNPFALGLTWDNGNYSSGIVAMPTYHNDEDSVTTAVLENKWVNFGAGDYFKYNAKSNYNEENDTIVYSGATTTKAMHWALIGDPYSFIALNRRVFEDSIAVAGSKASYYLKFNAEEDKLDLDELTVATTSGQETMEWSMMATKGSYESTTKAGKSNSVFLRLSQRNNVTAENDTTETQRNKYPYGTSNSYTMISRNKHIIVIGKDSIYVPGASTFNLVTNYSGLGISLSTVRNDNSTSGEAMVNGVWWGDNVQNDCFDGYVKVWNTDGAEPRLVYDSGGPIELPRYTSFYNGLPYAAKRWGCDYPEKITNQSATNNGTSESNWWGYADDNSSSTSRNDQVINTATTYKLLRFDQREESDNTKFLIKDYAVNTGVTEQERINESTIHCYYSVRDSAKQYFSPSADELTWVNAYTHWTDEVHGYYTTMRVVPNENVKIYTYNEDGLIESYIYPDTTIIDTTWVDGSVAHSGWLTGTDYESYSQEGFNRSRAYGYPSVQSTRNEMKWALVGDPYNFSLLNYDQYVHTSNTTYLIGNADSNVTSVQFSDLGTALADTASVQGAIWTVLVGDNGASRICLRNFNDTLVGRYGSGITFTRTVNNADVAATEQYLKLGSARNIWLTGLMEYASRIYYHLVLGTEKIPWIDGISNADGTRQLKEIKSTTLRDRDAYPIVDYMKEKVGVGNFLSLPDYMKREFCTYSYRLDYICDPTDTENPNKHLEMSYQTGSGDVKQALPDGIALTTVLQEFTDKEVHVNVLYDYDSTVFAADSTAGLSISDADNVTNWRTFETQETDTALLHYKVTDDALATGSDRQWHYTNDYLWSAVGDPYGFSLHNRYAAKNNNQWKSVVQEGTETDGTAALAWGNSAADSIFEMLPGSYSGAFVTHPISDFAIKEGGYSLLLDDDDTDSTYTYSPNVDGTDTGTRQCIKSYDYNDGYFLRHDATAATPLAFASGSLAVAKAASGQNWQLNLTPEQLMPYFDRAGYVGALTPEQALKNEELGATVKAGSATATQMTTAQTLVYTPSNLVSLSKGYWRLQAMPAKPFDTSRYASGYTHKIEADNGSIHLHFYETTEDERTKTTLADIPSDSLEKATDIKSTAEVEPVEYDPSSIFHITKASGDNLWNLSTQGLNLQTGYTLTTDETGGDIYIEDIGGTVVTLRPKDADITTNYYLAYEGYKTGTNAELSEGIYGHQQTKWMLQPVGDETDQYHNQMPLRWEVHKGGTGDDYYYATFYAPFDARLTSTADVAFTYQNTLPASGTVKLENVGRVTEQGNGQFIPSSLPVVIRAMNANNGAAKKYITLTLPNEDPTTGYTASLQGVYLEQELTGLSTGEDVYIFGLPTVRISDAEAANSHQVGFYKNKNEVWEEGVTDANKYVYHNKMYFVLPSSGVKQQFLPASFDADPVQDVPSDAIHHDGCVYDLSGRMVATKQMVQAGVWRRNLAPGIYIIDGRKIMVK